MIGLNGGGYFNYDDPTNSEYNIIDIAHSLANQCRFNGHTRKFYSVAEHSILVDHLYKTLFEDNKRTRLFALLHDAPEAFISDIPSPLKAKSYVMFQGQNIPISHYETRLMHEILQRLELDLDMDDNKLSKVGYCDRMAVMWEAQNLMSPQRKHKLVWGSWMNKYVDQVERIRKWSNPAPLHCYTPAEAEEEFINLYNTLRWQI